MTTSHPDNPSFISSATLSGFADEAADGLTEQIAVMQRLGWPGIDLRKVDGVSIHEHSLAACREMASMIADAGLMVTSLGSAIGAGGSSIDDDANVALGQAHRCVERARLFGTRQVRVMSWPPVRGASDRGIDEPTASRRIERLTAVCRILFDAGLQPLHENCHNYGGQSIPQTLRLIEAIPGLRLIFDTANPIGTDDWAFPAPRPKQSPWQFWAAVRDHVDQLHIKDAHYCQASRRMSHCLPGEGEGDVLAILSDACARGFLGSISLEPHLGGADASERADRFIAAGRRLEALLALLAAVPTKSP